jgi:hypothetical protein
VENGDAAALRAGGRPFLLLTAYQRSHLTGALRDAPLLNKPVDAKKLRQELSALLSGGNRPDIGLDRGSGDHFNGSCPDN